MGIALSKKHPRWDQILAFLADGQARKPLEIADHINLERWRIHCVLARMVTSRAIVRTRIGPSLSWYSIAKIDDIEAFDAERQADLPERSRPPVVVEPERIAYAASVWAWANRT